MTTEDLPDDLVPERTPRIGVRVGIITGAVLLALDGVLLGYGIGLLL